MSIYRNLGTTVRLFLFAGLLSAQTADKVEFARDILRIFKQNCVSCHGPSQQQSGLRLDRKSSLFKSGLRRLSPGSSANSFPYHRIAGTGFGLQMPPSGPLRPEQIAAVKNWIDQGADWPESLANEAELPPVNPKAVALIETLRAAGRTAFLKAAAANPKLLNARGPDGSTPFMYAALYLDAAAEPTSTRSTATNRRVTPALLLWISRGGSARRRSSPCC